MSFHRLRFAVILPFLILFILPAFAQEESIVAISNYECLLVQHGTVELLDLVEQAIRRGFSLIRIQPGIWEISRPVVIPSVSRPITLGGDPRSGAVILRARGGVGIILRQSQNVTLENLTVEGTLELDQTNLITIRDLLFRNGGVRLRGKKCNQPNECSSFNRDIRIEKCVFEDCAIGILAERMEGSIITGNRFRSGTNPPPSCDDGVVAIELNGSGEDLDRPLETGHSKANQILQNVFEQEGGIGLRLRDSLGNIIRDNRFERSYRAMEFQEGARYNQTVSNYITYLSQIPVPSSCPTPCAIYLAPGSVNNVFYNIFFEQNFELQFFERNRNRTFVIDESGGQNILRSDFLRIP